MTPVSLVLLVLYVCHVQGQTEPCTTTKGGRGNCISLYDCPSMIALVQKPQRTAEDVKLLRDAHCGFTSQNTPKVYCPAEKPSTSTTTTEMTTIAITTKPVDEGNRRSTNVCLPSANLPDPSGDCCGLDSSSGNKILNGVATSLEQYPWLALIEYSRNREQICGGSLISNQYVLTAAHCVVNARNKSRGAKSVRLGDYNITNSGKDCIKVEGGELDCNLGSISIPIAQTVVHLEYNSDKVIIQSNDIAVLKLNELAPYNDFIQPICLPILDVTKSPPPDLRLYVAGWGAVDEKRSTSDIKLHSDLPFVDSKVCGDLYSRNGVPLVWDKQICAGGELNKDSCKGDSGGPMMYLNDSKYELTGIISFGALQCGITGQPSIYTNVYEYLPWIRSIVNS